MKKLLIFLLIAIIVIAILFFTTPLGLLFWAITCSISPNCAVSPGSSEETISQAISSKDIKICDKLPNEVWFTIDDPRANCYIKYALVNKDEEVCSMMKEKRISSGNTIKIENISIENNPIECYIGIAILSGNPKICGMLDNIIPSTYQPYDFDKYYLKCYGGVAKKLQDKTLCDNLKGENRLRCLLPFSDISICEEFSENRKGFCEEWF